MSLIGNDYRKDEQILKIIEDARQLKISPYEAEERIKERLNEYFPPANVASISQTFQKIAILDELTKGFFSSGGGMATPLNERYALAHNLSGKLSPNTTLCPIKNDVYEEQKMKVTAKRTSSMKRKGISKKKGGRWGPKEFELAEKALTEMGYEDTIKDLDENL